VLLNILGSVVAYPLFREAAACDFLWFFIFIF
jgi:hypothetical protein